MKTIPNEILSSDIVERCSTHEGITSQCDRMMLKAEEIRKEILNLSKASEATLTWENTFGAFDDISLFLSEATYCANLFAFVHPDKTIRDVALLCLQKEDAFISDLYMDSDVYTVLEKASAILSYPEDSARAKFIRETIKEYKRNGLSLDSEKQQELRTLNTELTQTEQAFDRNIAESSTFIALKPEQLAGLPSSYIAKHKPDAEGLIRITTDKPDYVPFMTYAHDRETAQRLALLNENRAAEKNLPVFEKLLELRRKKCEILGYTNWAEYILETQMAKSPEVVHAFLNTIQEGILAKRDEEYHLVAERARALGLPCERICASDSVYLIDQLTKSLFSLDTQALSEYFEFNRVLQGIMDIASELYGITFISADAPVWHQDVVVYDVFYASDHQVFGRLYLDMHPRENKFQHMAEFTFRRTAKCEDGSRILPIVSLVCNFPKSSNETPALLSHDEVATLFHEFGHALHNLLSESELSSFSGTHVARDFVEVPSQLFEEWVWDRTALDRFAKHYITGEQIPDDMYTSLIRSQKFGLGLFTQRQLLFANLDLAYHEKTEAFDTTAVLRDMQAKYSPFAHHPEGLFQTSFGHLVGYSAMYYSYQWSLSIAIDLLSRFKANGMFDASTAAAYRETILKQGGGREETDMIKDFLGRPSDPNVYLDWLKIDSETA